MNQLENYFAIGTAIVELLQPLIEVVIHDVKTNEIIFIKGSLSKREVGDPSLLDAEFQEIESTVYSKINFDGRLIKSISIPIKEHNKIIALMCINYDTTLFKELNVLTEALLSQQLSKKPEILFKNDWQNKINEFIAADLRKRKKRFIDLTNKEKKQIIRSLFESDAFLTKNAADYIAKIMNMGRATIFNYLREFRRK